MEERKEIDMNMVTALMDETYTLAYVDCRESLDNNLDTIKKCLEEKNRDSLYETDMIALAHQRG
jgi:hypothetical protein